MAKSQKKSAKRVFFVRRNTDDISALRNLFPSPKDLLDLYEGEFIGSVGADESACEGKSRVWIKGWEIGHEQHIEAVECFERAREAGRKSAEAREAKQGTAQPEGGRGFRTKDRTGNRTGNRTPFGRTEHPSDDFDGSSDSEDPEHVDSDRIRQTVRFWTYGREPLTEHPSVTTEQTSEQVTELKTEPSSTHHPSPRNQDDPSNWEFEGVRVRANGKTQNENDECLDQDDSPRSCLLDFPNRGYRPARKIADLPPLKRTPIHLPGELEHA